MDNIDDINDAQVRVCVVSESLSCLYFLYYLGQNLEHNCEEELLRIIGIIITYTYRPAHVAHRISYIVLSVCPFCLRIWLALS